MVPQEVKGKSRWYASPQDPVRQVPPRLHRQGRHELFPQLAPQQVLLPYREHDRIWSMVPQLVDVTQFGYFKVVVKAKLILENGEKKIKEAGGDVVLTGCSSISEEEISCRSVSYNSNGQRLPPQYGVYYAPIARDVEAYFVTVVPSKECRYEDKVIPILHL